MHDVFTHHYLHTPVSISPRNLFLQTSARNITPEVFNIQKTCTNRYEDKAEKMNVIAMTYFREVF